MWKSHPCWGNCPADAPFYFRTENYEQTSTSLKFKTTRDNPILSPSSLGPFPNYVVKKYSCAEIDSDPCTGDTNAQIGLTWKYGYFEALIRNPKAQMMWPAFWLFGERNSKSIWNEIDCFEFATGDALITTNHWQTTNGNHEGNGKWIYSLPNQSFGSTWVTYAVKWEPNKIVWYINNKAIRVETDRFPSLSIIPSTAMRIMVGAGMSEMVPFDLNLPEVFPNSVELEYIRVYQRPDHNTPNPIFSVNSKTGFSPQTPMNIPFNNSLPIIMDASESYMPGHAYFLSVQRCDVNGNLFSPEASAWLNTTEVDNVNKLDLRVFAVAHGLTITQGNYYRIKLAGSSPWTESNQYLYTGTCSNQINFKVNGQISPNLPTIINISYNNGKPRVISELFNSISCDNSYFLSVAQCNSSGVVTQGTEKSKWLTSQEKNYVGYFDIENFCIQSGLPLIEGSYYKIKWAAGVPWTEKSCLIYILPCSSTISFDINRQTNLFPNSINIENGDDIVLDGSLSLFCNNNYFVSVQECNQNGIVAGGIEISELNPHFSYNPDMKEYRYSIGRYDIRDLCKRKNFILECGKFYRIKLATGSWVESSKVIYIRPCSNINNTFNVYNNDYIIKNCNLVNECVCDQANNITIYAQNAISCNQSYFLSIQKRLNGILVLPEAKAWLSSKDIYSLKTLGNLNLKTFARDPNGDGILTDGFELCNSSDPNYPNISYNLKLVAGSGSCNSFSWVENNKIIIFGSSSGKLASVNDTLPLNYTESLDDFQIYPNPSINDYFLIKSSSNKDFVNLKILNTSGKLIKIITKVNKEDIVDVSDLSSGLYFVQVHFTD